MNLMDLLPEQAKPNPEMQAALEKLREASEALEVTQRRQFLQWSMVFCRCRRWYALAGHADDNHPPQADCDVHGHVMITRNGEVL